MTIEKANHVVSYSRIDSDNNLKDKKAPSQDIIDFIGGNIIVVNCTNCKTL